MTANALDDQIAIKQKNVDYNTREFTIEIIVKKYTEGEAEDKNEIYVPDYQREFVWDGERQSKFIESIMLGLPIPLVFVAENTDGRLEIVDGSQRVRTLAAFIEGELEISGLEILTELNGLIFSGLSESRARKFKNTPIRMIVLADKTIESVKNDIFDRINRGSDLLKDMEKRKGIYRGKFNDFIYDKCSPCEKFRRVVRMNDYIAKRQEHEELVLRFFALADYYPNYERDVGIAKFLDNYLNDKNSTCTQIELDTKWIQFNRMLDYVEKNFPYGFSKGEINEVSRVYFEALSVGVHLALESGKRCTEDKEKIKALLIDRRFISDVSGKYQTHKANKMAARIDHIKNGLICD
jgi:hypothetical protein